MLDSEDDFRAVLIDSATAFMADHRDRQTAGPDLWRAVVAQGWTGMMVPEAAGGSELGLDYAAELMALLGRYRLAAPLLTGALVPSAVLRALPGDAAAAGIAGGIAAGTGQVPLAWQETPGQIDPDAPGVTLAEGRLRGTKVFVPGADTADGFLVPAMTPDGMALLHLAADTEGLAQRGYPLGDGSQAADLTFDAVAINPDRIIARGDDAAQAVAAGVAAGMLLRAAQLSGLAAATLEQTIAYLRERVQFGQKLSEFQVLQHRVVDLYGLTRLANASWRNALRRMQADPGTPETQIALSAAKARCGDVGNQVAKAAIQLHGAFGFTEASGMGDILYSALAWSASFGNADVHRNRMYALQEAAQ